MRKLTKKSLDELAKTMNVIPESERDGYWGMYDNDCFWRCVAYLKGNGISEDAAASWAYGWYVSEHGYSGINHLSSTNDSAIDKSEMDKFLQANSMVVGSSTNNRMVGMLHTNDFEYYKNNGNISPSANHCLILQSVNPDGSYNMYDPQNNMSFSITSENERNQLVGLNF